jgi:hypothetical protein
VTIDSRSWTTVAKPLDEHFESSAQRPGK